MTGIIKKKRVSKRNKSSWRKHVDISDVENFLEEKRLDERLGDYSVLSNNELFQLDTGGENTKKKLPSKQTKREQLRKLPYKCLSLLKPLTKVPDPIKKRNTVKSKEERKSVIRKKRELSDLKSGNFKSGELQSLTDIKKAQEKRKNKEGKYNFKEDIWSNDSADLNLNSKLNGIDLQDEWIVGDSKRHFLSGLGKTKKNIPKTVHKKPYVINSVDLPHPGMSYNPSYEDHQSLLRDIAAKEEKIIKEEQHLERVTSKMFRKVSAPAKDNNWLVEMSEGINKPDVSEIKEEESDGDIKSNPPVKNKEKSKKQKRIKKEQQKLAEERRLAKIEKKKVTDLHRLRFIEKSIEKLETKSMESHEIHVKKEEEKKREAKRLGPNKFQEPDLEFNMPSDIRGNLRNVKKEGNLLSDRFKSLQKRNILEPTIRKNRRKAKVKKFVKPGFKDDWKVTVARVN